MFRRIRAPLAAMTLILSLVASVSPVTAGNEETGEVVFRVTLEGDVPATHTFAVRHECEETCSTESITIACSPPNPTYDYDPCAAGTYDVSRQMPIGLAVEYALLRWTTPDLSHTDDQPEEYLHGAWTIHEGRQVIALGFDYSGAVTPAPTPGVGGGPSPVLPDTAMPAP